MGREMLFMWWALVNILDKILGAFIFPFKQPDEISVYSNRGWHDFECTPLFPFSLKHIYLEIYWVLVLRHTGHLRTGHKKKSEDLYGNIIASNFPNNPILLISLTLNVSCLLKSTPFCSYFPGKSPLTAGQNKRQLYRELREGKTEEDTAV